MSGNHEAESSDPMSFLLVVDRQYWTNALRNQSKAFDEAYRAYKDYYTNYEPQKACTLAMASEYKGRYSASLWLK